MTRSPLQPCRNLLASGIAIGPGVAPPGPRRATPRIHLTPQIPATGALPDPRAPARQRAPRTPARLPSAIAGRGRGWGPLPG